MVMSDENARNPSSGKSAGHEDVQIQVYNSYCAVGLIASTAD